IRQSFHELEEYLKHEYYYIIIARKPAAEMDFFDVKKSLVHVLKLSGVFAKKPPAVDRKN
ncbi:MAG: ribonuclease P protein component, partial [Bacillales bacterium]